MVRQTGLVFGLLAGMVVMSSSELRADFTPIAGFDRQLFPSYLIATAGMRSSDTEKDASRLGDPAGLLGVEVTADEADVPVRVTIECPEYFEPSVYSGTLTESETTYRITPKIRFRYEKLAQCSQAAPVSITFRVQLGEGPEEEQTVTCTMRSINDCPFGFRNGDGMIDASFTFAAYINEQHPFVDKLLREALDRGIVKSFDGYQSRDPDQVIRQAYAIWDLLVARDIRYSSITTTAISSESVACQHVRLIEDSVNNSQANCVDGSVLWVSMLRKIGINGFLVVTESHCYAGFYLTPGGEGQLGVETTLLGAEVPADQIEVADVFNTAVPEELRNEDSFLSFVAALEKGTAAWMAGQEKQKTLTEPDPNFQVIDVAQIRRQGVMPIPFQSKETFVSYDFTAASEEDATAESGDTESAESEGAAETMTESESGDDSSTESSEDSSSDTVESASSCTEECSEECSEDDSAEDTEEAAAEEESCDEESSECAESSE
ncbi:MAG: hypothetical protein ACK526_08530 [Planctomyces sp.]